MKYAIDDLLVDMNLRRVTRNGTQIALPEISWRVFAALIERAPETVTYNELASRAWRQEHVTHDTMSQRIRLLRQAMGDPSTTPRYIGNVRGEGYRLIAEAVPAEEAHPRLKGMLPGIAGAGAVLAGAFIFVMLTRAPDAGDAPGGPSSLSASLSADDFVARGRDYLTRGSREANENALRLFAQAREIEPDNVDAMIGLSFAYSHRATKYDFGANAALEAEVFARKALEKAAQNALSWHALGFSLDAQGRISEALRAYEQAIAIEPNDVNAASSAAYLLQVQGRLHEALLLEA